jgi:hypothetical protein
MKRVALLFLLLTSACHSDTSDKPSDKTELVISKEEVMSHDAEQSKNESQKIQLKELNTQPKSELLTKNTSFKLNDEKFSADNSVLRKGDSVYNLSMSEFGVLKGSFVVVTRVDVAELILENYKSELIATNTFRLVPIVTDSSLIVLYQQLRSAERLARVEIEIDYSKQNSQSAY